MAKPRILIVEDEPVTVAAYRAMLEAEFELVVVQQSAKAIAQAEALKPHLIILDLNLPDVDGYQLARYFRIEPATSHLPILIVSGFINNETHTRLEGLGHINFMDKPVEAEALVQALRTSLQG